MMKLEIIDIEAPIWNITFKEGILPEPRTKTFDTQEGLFGVYLLGTKIKKEIDKNPSDEEIHLNIIHFYTMLKYMGDAHQKHIAIHNEHHYTLSHDLIKTLIDVMFKNDHLDNPILNKYAIILKNISCVKNRARYFSCSL